jgi:hypothetical protein
VSLPLVPIGIGALVVVAWIAQGRRGETPVPGSAVGADGAPEAPLTREQQAVYETAMRYVPATEEDRQRGKVEKLERLADVFEANGHPRHAEQLRKRSRLRALPPELLEARADVLRRALSSSDRATVLEVERAFREAGCTGAADKLSRYAEGLE